MLNRKQPPIIKNAVDFNFTLKPYEKFSLDNGIDVIVLNAGVEDVIQLELLFNAGNEAENKNLVAGCTNYLLKNGTKTKTAYEINEFFEYYGSYLNRNTFNETSNITLHCLAKHFEKLLPQITDLVTNAIFPEEELKIFVQNSKQKLAVNLKKSDFVANQKIDALLYGETHPYGKYTKMDDYDKVSTSDLREFYEKNIVNGTCTILIAGKLQPNYLQLLNSNFGSLNFKKADYSRSGIPAYNTNKKENRIIRINNDENGVQGSIRIAQNFPNRHHPHFMQVQVLNTLFGGYFGSRLMSNIREDKGYTYGIHSYLQNHVQQSAWMISTDAGKDVCEATIQEVYNEMKLLREELVSEDELLLVRNFLLGTLLGDLDGPFQIIGRWKTYLLNGLDEAYFHNAVNTIKTITPQTLQELANIYLHPDQFYEMVVI
jgi:zinc protease